MDLHDDHAAEQRADVHAELEMTPGESRADAVPEDHPPFGQALDRAVRM